METTKQLSKHTPGPWTIQAEPGCCFHEGNHYAITQEGEDQGESWWATIAEIWPTSGDNGEADARLIAAAPDLLTATRKMLALVDNAEWTQAERLACIHGARAAVAKAEQV
jgi:hypothetical protein